MPPLEWTGRLFPKARLQRGEMARIALSAVEPAIRSSVDPLAIDLVARLDQDTGAPPHLKTTRPFPRRAALEIYRRKAAKGDRPAVHTDGYQALLAALAAAPEGEVIVHGVTFADAVYLVLTDAARHHCLGVLRKRRLVGGT
jgi:hypothetical protein